MIDGCDAIQKALMLTSPPPPPTTHLARVADLRCGWRRISISVGVSEARVDALFSSLQSQIW